MNKLFIFGLTLLCFAVYFNGLDNDFVFDDRVLIVDNPFVSSPKLAGKIFKNALSDEGAFIKGPSMNSLPPSPRAKYYRPLQVLSYILDYKIWKLNPFGYHLTNLLLHLFNALLVYYLLFNIFKDKAAARIASILFAVHPIHTSAVSYISGRADLLVCFFMLVSIILFLKFLKLNSKFWYLLSLLSASAAFFCRENALLLFLFIGLVLFTLDAKAKYYWYILPFALLDLFYLLFRLFIFGFQAQNTLPSFLPLPLQIINFFAMLPAYLSILLLPRELFLSRAIPDILNFYDWRIFLALGFILFIAAVIVKFRKNKLVLFAVLWFLTGVIPAFVCMNMYRVPGEIMMAEHWLYISSLGFFVIFTYLLRKIPGIGNWLLACFIIFYGSLTIIQNKYWKNELVLYKNILENNSPRNCLRFNLVNSYLTEGAHEDALREINKFAVFYPDTAQLYYLWGNYYFATREVGKAEENYKRALEKDGQFFFAYYYLGLLYEVSARPDKAIDCFLKCFKIKPYYVPNLVRLGDLYSRKNKFKEAARYYGLALEIEPDNRLLMEKINNAE